MAEFLHQLAVTSGFFHRVQVGALDVLDNRDLENLGVIEVAQKNRNLVKFGNLRGPPAAFARNDLELALLAGGRAHDQRLNDALFIDRRREILERVLVETAARLIGVGMDLFDGNKAVGGLGSLCARLVLVHVGHQGGKAAAQPALLGCLVGHVRLLRLCGCPRLV